ncbi:hypothetical protein K435DRAFT_855690 [Dendrothele bispora CBS 962.96]|uniref:Uncharacterized protein n=1 Tax=Dendrothele bispora (strain CBS 962.96) TaxID=1314807 RepID=A0A4V6T5I5_DENBC|nr:hypothetical protein K435DRAFT_855690 [Dendrothele bispora CBS 962.96]
MFPNASTPTASPPTADELAANPSLLLHRPPGPRPATAYDASAAAVIDDGRFFVTTPYPQLPIPNPVLTVDAMRLREDFRYGEHDYLQWPQEWCPALCHLSCIMSKPPEDHRLAIMWWNPDTTTFVEERRGIVAGLGRLKSSRHRELRDAVKVLESCCESFIQTHSNSTEVELAQKYRRLLSERLLRLESFSTSYRQMRIGVVSLQRTFLELQALLDYCLVFKPSMEGRDGAVSSPHSVIGSFVWDLDIAAQLYRAGIPFWFIHSVSDVARIAVKRLTPLLSFDKINRNDCPFVAPVVFKGVPNLGAQYAAISEDAAGAFRTFSPFNLAASSSLVMNTGPQRTQRSHSNKPYRKAPSINPAAGRNKFSLPSNPLFPPSLQIWNLCLSEVDVTNPPAERSGGFCFPDAQLFVSVQKREKTLLYIKNWLRFRDILLFWLLKPSPSLILNHVWRQLLGGEFRSPNNSSQSGSVPSVESKLTRAAVRKLEVRNLLGTCLTESGVELNLEAPLGPVSWRGQSVGPDQEVSDSIVREVLWELSELNFRCELSALDKILTRPGRQSPAHHTKLLHCLFERGDGDVLTADVFRASQGLAARLPAWRKPYLFAFRDVMMDWLGADKYQDISNYRECESQNDLVLEVFERPLVQIYLQHFFDVFGRAATVPLRLDN